MVLNNQKISTGKLETILQFNTSYLIIADFCLTIPTGSFMNNAIRSSLSYQVYTVKFAPLSKAEIEDVSLIQCFKSMDMIVHFKSYASYIICTNKKRYHCL